MCLLVSGMYRATLASTCADDNLLIGHPTRGLSAKQIHHNLLPELRFDIIIFLQTTVQDINMSAVSPAKPMYPSHMNDKFTMPGVALSFNASNRLKTLSISSV